MSKFNIVWTIKGTTTEVSTLGVGEYTVTITALAGSGYSGNVSKDFIVLASGTEPDEEDGDIDILTKTIYFPNGDNVSYNNTNYINNITMAFADSGDTLSTNDFTITWAIDGNQTSSIINVGTYTATITAKPNSGYTGSKSVNFTVKPLDISNATVYLPNDGGTVGSTILNDVKILMVNANGYLLTTEDYSYQWKSPTGTVLTDSALSSTVSISGTYYLTLTAKGSNFTGTATVPYVISEDTSDSKRPSMPVISHNREGI